MLHRPCASIATFPRNAPPFPGGLLNQSCRCYAHRFQLELGRDRVSVLYAPRTANNKPRGVITRRDFAQIGRVINSCGQSAPPTHPHSLTLPPPSLLHRAPRRDNTARPSTRALPFSSSLFVAALCGFVARTNPRQGYFNSEAAAERFQTVINSCVEGPSPPVQRKGCDEQERPNDDDARKNNPIVIAVP